MKVKLRKFCLIKFWTFSSKKQKLKSSYLHIWKFMMIFWMKWEIFLMLNSKNQIQNSNAHLTFAYNGLSEHSCFVFLNSCWTSFSSLINKFSSSSVSSSLMPELFRFWDVFLNRDIRLLLELALLVRLCIFGSPVAAFEVVFRFMDRL